MSKSVEQVARELERYRRKLPTRVGNEIVNFALDNFRSESFAGTPWPRRRSRTNRPGRKLLVDTGRLRRSIRITRVTRNSVSVGSDVPYAEVHNQGQQVNATQQVSSHTRRRKGQREKVRAHSRRMNFKMPQRQFLGRSKELNRRITKMIETDLRRIL